MIWGFFITRNFLGITLFSHPKLRNALVTAIWSHCLASNRSADPNKGSWSSFRWGPLKAHRNSAEVQRAVASPSGLGHIQELESDTRISSRPKRGGYWALYIFYRLLLVLWNSWATFSTPSLTLASPFPKRGTLLQIISCGLPLYFIFTFTRFLSPLPLFSQHFFFSFIIFFSSSAHPLYLWK